MNGGSNTVNEGINNFYRGEKTVNRGGKKL